VIRKLTCLFLTNKKSKGRLKAFRRPETFAKFKLPPKKSDSRHSRVGGNPGAWHTSACLINTSMFTSGFPPTRE
ncbi:hypothetical protein, partial [Neisseria dentiae]|uniref:hypothetical protein n=1 Tax=Neisseria dentiae TaxID=194197 RepID=UPI00359F4A60